MPGEMEGDEKSSRYPARRQYFRRLHCVVVSSDKKGSDVRVEVSVHGGKQGHSSSCFEKNKRPHG